MSSGGKSRGRSRAATGAATRATAAEAAPRAIVVGSAMIDVIVTVAPENIERMAMRNEGSSFLLLEEGRKIAAEAIGQHVGGGGCNVAVALGRLGWRPRLVAKVGRDDNADRVRAHLAAAGVETDALPISEAAATGVSVVVASHERNAGIFVHRGANERLRGSEIPRAAFEGARLVYIAPLSSGSADCFPLVAEQGRFVGATVAANPGIRHLTSRTEAFFGALGNLDLLSVNADEAAALAPGLAARGAGPAFGAPRREPPEDAPRLIRRGLGFGGHHMSLRDTVAALHAAGPRWVSVTDGAHGAYLSSRREGAPPELLFCPPAPAEVATTAGAGDAYSATLAAALAVGRDPIDAMRRAAVNAASVVSRLNTSDGLLSAAALEAAIETGAPAPRSI